MKKPIYLTIVALAIASLTLAQSQNVIFETIYLNPKMESLKELGDKMKTHNQKYHTTPPYTASVWNVLTGERSGDMLWIMGPFTFADLDNRPAEGSHDDDWSGNVLPLTHGMHDGYYWKLIPEFAYTPSEDYRGNVMRVRTLDIKPGKMEEFRREFTRIFEVVNANKLGNSFSVYNNLANDGERDVALVWQFKNYAQLDLNVEFSKKYEAKFGDNSWNEFQEAMREIVDSSSDELLEVIPEMSVR
jgi:hypothetical protein